VPRESQYRAPEGVYSVEKYAPGRSKTSFISSSLFVTTEWKEKTAILTDVYQKSSCTMTYAYKLGLLVVLVGSFNFPMRSETCAATETVHASRNRGLDLWTDCTGDKRFKQTFAVPTGARFFPFKSSILRDSYDGPYAKNVTKVDIFWIEQGVITVNEPLLSYGGDIILFAETININAPIDSRVYIEHDVDNFSPTRPIRFGSALKTSEAAFKIRPDYEKAFNDYFNSCIGCGSVNTRRTEMPSGLAAPTAFGPLAPSIDGSAPPDGLLIPASTTSGNIYLFAEHINIAKSLSDPISPDPRADCNNSPDAFVTFAINASGLRGGKGGPGSTSTCIARSANGIDCADVVYRSLGGKSAPGGVGGDAGDVHLFFVASAKGRNLDNSAYEHVTNVSGGLPGDNNIYATPAAEGLPIVNRCSFVLQSKAPPLPEGKAGHFFATEVDSFTALKVLSSIISEHDLRMDTDYFSLMTVALVDPSISSLKPSASLTDFLTSALISSELTYVNDVDSMVDGLPIGKHSYVSSMLSGLVSQDQLRQLFLADQQPSIAREIIRFSNSKGVSGYLHNTGGLFNVRAKAQVEERMRSGQLRVDVSVGNTTLASLDVHLIDIDHQLFDAVSSQKTAEMRSQIDALLIKIQQAEAEAAKQREATAKGPFDIFIALKELAETLVAWAESLYSGNYAAAAEATPKLAKELQALSASLPYFNNAKVATLRQQLEILTLEFSHLAQFVSESKEFFLSQRFSAEASLLKARASLQSKLVSDSFLLSDLVKVSLISYLEDPSKDKSILRNNLSGVRTYLVSFPQQEPFINLGQIEWNCPADPASCLTVEASEHWRESKSQVDIGKERQSVSIYVIAPTPRRLLLPLFTLSPGAVVTSTTSPPQ
jgi:hypothetical protein